MKKSKQLKVKDVINSNNSNTNTKIKLKILGKVELKYISVSDFNNFLKILTKETIEDREFVRKIIYKQLIKPEIDFEKFEQLNDEDLIKIAKDFVKREEHTFQYFKDTGDFFKDFRIAIKNYNKKLQGRIKKSLYQIIKSTQETLKTFNRDYSTVIHQALDSSSYIKESLHRIKTITELFKEPDTRIAKSFKPILEQYQATSRIIAESLKPQIDLWQKWTEQNKPLFENIGKFWSNFYRRFKIAEQKAVTVLQKYKWFISPSLPSSFVFEIMQLDKNKGRQDKAVNRLFIDYFSSNSWENLEIMVSGWKNNPLFRKRMKILFDCVQVLKQAQGKKINETNVVLPTIIIQIDGILTDYLDLNNIQWEVLYDDCLDKKGNVRRTGRKDQFRRYKSKSIMDPLYNLAIDIFLNILFQKSQKGQPLKTPFNFNRHKIIHGESIKYGRKNYLIRAFLVLDFLSHLK